MDYLTAIRSFGDLGLTSLRTAFADLNERGSLVEIEADGDTSEVTDFFAAWAACSSLTSFPLLDVSAGTDFTFAWAACSSLTSFPELDVSAGTNFAYAWGECSGLTSFPLLDISAGTDFRHAWGACSGLTSFPELDVSAGTDFADAWYKCESLTTFPAGMFDTCLATAFGGAFMFCPLTSDSVDNILVSLDTAGQSNGTLDMGGSCEEPGPAGATALLSLEGKGWTVEFHDIN